MGTIYSVSQITKYLKGLIEKDAILGKVSVKGELSNVTYHSSGHIYFTLKDNDAALSAVMFSNRASGLSFRLEAGMEVIVSGSFGVYEKTGRYQIYAESIKKSGTGELFEKYLELKQELEDAGMFSDLYKRDIPVYIKRLGVVTAPTGAAVRDIINITRRRNPYVEILLYPAKVQGTGGARTIVKGIEVLDKAGVDVMIVGRGGGSIEDLWEFNERIVAEAIFASNTPVISAVGHETDFTIADFVADLRAPTPSAAAELAVYDYREYQSDLSEYRQNLENSMLNALNVRKLKLKQYEKLFRDKRPDAVVNSKRMRLSEAENELRQLMRDMLTERRNRLLDAERRLPERVKEVHLSYRNRLLDIERRLPVRIREMNLLYRSRLSDIERRLPENMEALLKEKRHTIAIYAGELKAVSPLEKLTMGYSFVTDDKGKAVRDVDKVNIGDTVNIHMLNGKVTADVKGREKIEH